MPTPGTADQDAESQQEPVPTPRPTARPAARAAPRPSGFACGRRIVHIVQPGQNLFRIALRYRTTINAIARLNGITNTRLVRAGQRLVIVTCRRGGAEPDVAAAAIRRDVRGASQRHVNPHCAALWHECRAPHGDQPAPLAFDRRRPDADHRVRTAKSSGTTSIQVVPGFKGISAPSASTSSNTFGSSGRCHLPSSMRPSRNTLSGPSPHI